MYNIGDTIYLELLNYDDKKETERYKCRVVDRINHTIYIDYPINEKTKKQGIFPNGTKFRACFIGTDQAIYVFDTEIMQHVRKQIPMLLLTDPGKEKYMRIQRRQHVRVDTSLDIAIHSCSNNFKPFVTVTADISGGGMAAILPKNHPLRDNQEIKCWISVHMQSNDIKYITTKAKVVRIKQPKAHPREIASIQFLDISQQDQQLLVRYCFERQLYLKKKGVLE